MTFELARALLNAEAVAPVPLARALFTVATEGVPLTRALVAMNILPEARLEEELGRVDAPSMHQIVPVHELLDLLPTGLCSRLLALPIRKDPRTGTVDVAVVDARDPHAAAEIGFFLQAPVRVVRTTLAAMEAALDHGSAPSNAKAEALAPPMGGEFRAPPKRTLQIQPSSIPPPHPSAEMPIPLMKRNPLPQFAVEDDAPATIEEGVEDVVLELRPPSRRGHATPDARHVRSAPEPRVPSVAPPPDGIPAMPFPDSSPILAALRSASSRDEILASLLLGLRSVARKAGLLVWKKDQFVGWMCNAELADISAFRTIAISAVSPSIFTTAAAGQTYLGPLYRDRASAPLLDVMGSASPDVAIAPVRVLGKTAVLVVADELGDTMMSTKAMEELARAAGEALARVVRRRA